MVSDGCRLEAKRGGLKVEWVWTLMKGEKMEKPGDARDAHGWPRLGQRQPSGVAEALEAGSEQPSQWDQ